MLIWVGMLTALTPCIAQQSSLATLRGTVIDPSGAVMPNAAVEAINEATAATREAVTNAHGDYEIPYLDPGTYRVTCSASGFVQYVAQGVILLGNETRRIDMKMRLGAANTRVTVTAGAAVISTENARITGGFTSKVYETSPVSTQNFPQAQMLMSPLVQSNQGSFALTIAGLPDSQVGESMDGIQSDGTVNLVNNAHATQDLRVIASLSPAEYSRPVNFTMVGKGGSNAFHGSVHFDEVNSALNARFALYPTKPSFKTHLAIGELGGPLKKNRTFFYVNYTLIRVPSSSFYYRNVPDQNERDGNFSELSVPIINPYTGTQLSGNIIPPQMQSSVALAMQKNYIPLPNLGITTLASNNYGYYWPHPTDLYKFDSWNVRIDHNFSSKHTLFGRYMDRITPYLLPGSFPQVGTWTRNRYHHSVVLSDTYSISSTLVNNFRWGWAYDHIHDGIPELGFTPVSGDKAVTAIGLQGVNPQGYKVMGFPDTTITGVSRLYQQPGGVPQATTTFSYGDSLSWAKGRHVAKFGAELRTWHNPITSYPTGTYGNFSFDGSFTGNAYADFLLGLPITSSRLNPLVNRTSHAYEMGYYAEDTFKVTPKLTLNLGLRWEYFSWPTYDDGLMYNWNPTNGDVIVSQSALSKVSPLYPTNITVTTGQVVPTPDKNLWRPRIGVAYRFSGTTVIRGGVGMFSQALGSDEAGPATTEALLTSPAPFSIAETYINSFTAGRPLFAFPDPFPSSLASAVVPSQSVIGYPSSITNGNIYEFTLSLEHQVHSVGLSIAYIGNRARNYNYMASINKPKPSTVPFTQSRRPFPQFVGTSYYMSNGASNYDALLLEAKRRVGNFTFDANYTYANNMANYLNTENPYNLLQWNHTAYNARHRFVAEFMYNFPFGHGKRFGNKLPGPVNVLVGNWYTNWITTLQSGQYFTPSYSGADPSNTSTFGGIPDRICNGNLSSPTTSQWFDTSCFAVPQAGHFGNSGVNILEGPPFHVSDMTLGKQFLVLNEKLRINFEGLFLDVFNTPTYSFPYSNISVPTQAGRLYAPLGGLNVGGGMVEAGMSRAIVLRLRLSF